MEDIIKYIECNRFKTRQRDMAKNLGVSLNRLRKIMHENNLKITKEQSRKIAVSKMKGRTNFTKEEDLFLRENYLKIPIKTMGAKLGRSSCGIKGALKRMGLVVPREILKKNKEKALFKKGHTPLNKGKKTRRLPRRKSY